MSTDPYPGLRPFGREESDIFFGRETHIDLLLEKLQNTHFVAVFGPSGFGKSSLVRAGLLPALVGGSAVKPGARWRIVEMRPGNQPYTRLAEALAQHEILGTPENRLESRFPDDPASQIQRILEDGPLGLKAVLDEVPLPARTNLLLLGGSI